MAQANLFYNLAPPLSSGDSYISHSVNDKSFIKSYHRVSQKTHPCFKCLLLPQKKISISTLGEEKIGFKVGKERGYPEDFQTPPIIFIPGAILIEL